MVDVNQFKAKLKGGGARPNLFRVVLTFPLGIADAETTEKFSFLCKATAMPAENMGVVPVNYLGRTLKLAGDRTFEDWSVVCINDTDFALKDAFERWNQIMNAHFANVGTNAPADYMVDAEVQQLDRRHNIIKTYKMLDVWPSNVDQIALSMDANDSIEEFGVVFQYYYWTSNTTL